MRIVRRESSADHQVREIPKHGLVRADAALVVDGSRLQTEHVQQVRERVARRIDVGHLARRAAATGPRPSSAPRAPGAGTPLVAIDVSLTCHLRNALVTSTP